MFCVIIYGPPASGKLTVAKELGRMAGWPVHHNHLGVDAALSLFAFGSEGFCRLRERIWFAAFEEASQAGRSFIFTFAPERTVRAGLIDELTEVVTRAAGTVVFVELTCANAELERRLAHPDRVRYGKLQSVASYRELQAAGAFEFARIPPPNIRIATDQFTPAQSATTIMDALRTRGIA
jgi:hypothetical protein